MHELPLLIFTLCLQGSVGVTVWLALGRQYAVEGRVPARGALPAMAGAFVLACVGLLASALHMGYPLNALNALRHVASSWLSREIVFASLYLAALGLGIVLLFFRKPGWQPLWLADINAVDTTVVTFPHHPLQALAQLRDVYLLGWCVSAAGMLCFAAGGLRNARGTLVAGSVLLLLGEIMLRYVFFSIG
ncbi:dimethyl sulfoxide reductase anchor subunit [Salmonella enterica]|nr:dimethyl sulfoxide reductase anchor subunit [Salmonella enterica]